MIRYSARSEADENEDASLFDVGKTVSKSEIDAEVRSSGNRGVLVLILIGCVLSLGVVVCIAASAGVYWFVKAREADKKDDAEKKPLEEPKEIKARITALNPEQKSIELLVRIGKRQTFQVTAETEFFDLKGARLPNGLASPELSVGEDVTILPTQDHQSLRWLKVRRD